MDVEIALLGRFGVRRDGRVLADAEFGGRRVRQLIRMLAAGRGHVVSRDALIEALWGDRLPADPATNLNVVVNRARRALGESDCLQTTSGGYLLSPGPGIVVDVERFESRVAQARHAWAGRDDAAAARAALDALELWDEPLPEDAYAEWARPHRDRLERLHQEALELGAEASLALGPPHAAVGLAADAVARQPLREAAHVLLIRALADEGDHAAAISAYLALRAVLADELGIDPTPEAVALYEQLLHGTLPTTPARPRSSRGATPLVGRDRELGELLALDGDSRIGIVAGRSGAGKSRLLEALAIGTDRRVLVARALLPEREEPWSVVRSLLDAAPTDAVERLDETTRAALAGVLTDVDAPDTAVDQQSGRALVRQGMVRVIAQTAPSLVIVDDCQWADSSSLDVLAVLVGRRADVVTVFAYRPEEVAEDSPVARFLAVLGNEVPVEVSLGPLDESSLGRLVDSPAVAAALAEHTDGTPFAVLQATRTLEREGLLRRTPSGTWEEITKLAPDRVREVARAGKRDAVWRQFANQPREARELLGCLALLGRPAPARLLCDACGVPLDDAMRTLRDLGRNHLVRHDPGGFRVDHDLVGETVRDRMVAFESARLHHLLALALERDGAPEEERARHLAGAGDATAAAEAYAASSRARLDRFADREAHDLAQEGLGLRPTGHVRAALLEVRAETLARHGDLASARDDLRSALTDVTSRSDRARLLTRLADLTAGSDDLLRASELTDLALAEAAGDPAARARALYTRSLIEMNLDRRDTAEAGFEEALELFTRVGDTNGMAGILEARAMLAFGFSDIAAGVSGFDRVARLFTDSGNLLRAVFPRSTRGHGLMFSGRPDEGLVDTGAALDLARSLGYTEGEQMVLWHHAEVLVACGRVDEGLAVADEALALATRLGHRGWTATALLAIGVARRVLGDLPGAAAALEQSIETSGKQLVMFRVWGHARLAQVLVAQGRYEEAATQVERALETGPELCHYEARLARCELAVARGDEDADCVVAETLRLATAGGHHMSAARLRELANQIVAAERPEAERDGYPKAAVPSGAISAGRPTAPRPRP